METGINKEVALKADMRLLVRAVMAADRYRQMAAQDSQNAAGNLTTAEFQAKWKKDTLSLFEGLEWQLKHFFGFSLIVPGSMDSEGAMIACYNPWLDVAIIQRWELRLKDERLAEAAFVTGEYLRGEKLGENAACPAWIVRKGVYKSKERAIAELCTKTVEAFQGRFPMSAAPMSLLKALWKDGEEREEQLNVASARMLFREAYKAQAFNKSTLRASQQAVARIKRLLVAGKLDDLLGSLAARQDRYVAETAIKLPEEVRARLVAQWYLRSGKNALVFLGAPMAPRFFVSVSVSLSEKGATPETLFVYDFAVAPKKNKRRLAKSTAKAEKKPDGSEKPESD